MKLLLLLLGALLPLASCQCSSNSDCLFLYQATTDVDSAEGKCISIGGHLVSIHNTIDNANVANLISRYGSPGDNYWIGLEGYKGSLDSAVQNYRWTDGTSYNWNNFKTGNPQGSGRVCTMWSAGGVWSVVPCSGNKAKFICLIKAQKIKNNCPNGYFWYEPTNMCYQLHQEKVIYQQAKVACQARGDVLPSVHSQDQHDFLISHAVTDTWLGMYFDRWSSQWKWEDGSYADYFNWYPGEPNNMNCEFWVNIVLIGYRGKWNNLDDKHPIHYFCQRPNPSNLEFMRMARNGTD